MPLGIVVWGIKVDKDVEKPGTVREFPSRNDRTFFSRSLKSSGWGQLSAHDAVKELDVEFEVEGNQIRNLRRYSPLPDGVRRLVDQHGHECEHVGLVLDKYGYRYGNQELSRGILEQVVAANARAPKEFLTWRNRHRDVLTSAGAAFLSCTTTGPLTLHLARASALENAGICLHPLYGCARLGMDPDRRRVAVRFRTLPSLGRGQRDGTGAATPPLSPPPHSVGSVARRTTGPAALFGAAARRVRIARRHRLSGFAARPWRTVAVAGRRGLAAPGQRHRDGVGTIDGGMTRDEG